MNAKIVVLAGPGGVGKNTILKGLLAARPQMFVGIRKYTTRAQRVGEGDEEFHFISQPEFEEKIRSNELLEHNVFNHQAYGIPKTPIDTALQANKYPVITAEANGMQALRKAYPEQTLAIFLIAPLETLKRRLLNRGESRERTQKRLQIAQEIELPGQNRFDVVLSNDDGEAETVVKKILDLLPTA